METVHTLLNPAPDQHSNTYRERGACRKHILWVKWKVILSLPLKILNLATHHLSHCIDHSDLQRKNTWKKISQSNIIFFFPNEYYYCFFFFLFFHYKADQRYRYSTRPKTSWVLPFAPCGDVLTHRYCWVVRECRHPEFSSKKLHCNEIMLFITLVGCYNVVAWCVCVKQLSLEFWKDMDIISSYTFLENLTQPVIFYLF